MIYDIFISYRREKGDTYAKLIYSELMRKNYNVIIDRQSVYSDNYIKKLMSIIDECQDFIFILTPSVFDRCHQENDIVHMELKRALDWHKNIILIKMPGFDWPKLLPESLEKLRYFDWIEYNETFFNDGTMNHLVKTLKSSPKKIARDSSNRAGNVAGKYLLRILIVLFILAAGTVITHFMLEKDNAKTTGITTTLSNSSSDTHDLSFTDNETPLGENCLSPSDYEVYYADAFSFGYPKYIFNHSWISKNERNIKLWYDDDYELTIEILTTADGVGPLESVHSYYETYINNFDYIYFSKDASTIDNTDFTRSLIGGYDYDNSHGTYKIMASDGEYDYILTFEYPDDDITDQHKEINYIVDCIYRYCSFSGATYEPRTYSQFIADDYGTKK